MEDGICEEKDEKVQKVAAILLMILKLLVKCEAWSTNRLSVACHEHAESETKCAVKAKIKHAKHFRVAAGNAPTEFVGVCTGEL